MNNFSKRSFSNNANSFEAFNQWNQAQGQAAEYAPAYEMKESKNEYFVTLEIPGITKEDLTVDFSNNYLVIRGEKLACNDKKEGARIQYSERYFGHFCRTIAFTEEVEVSKVDAQYKDGVLAVTLPKKPTDKATSRTISIR